MKWTPNCKSEISIIIPHFTLLMQYRLVGRQTNIEISLIFIFQLEVLDMHKTPQLLSGGPIHEASDNLYFCDSAEHVMSKTEKERERKRVKRMTRASHTNNTRIRQWSKHTKIHINSVHKVATKSDSISIVTMVTPDCPNTFYLKSYFWDLFNKWTA